MKKNYPLRKPDYTRSIPNIVSSLLEYYHCPTRYPSLAELREPLGSNAKNVLVIILDGMGTELIKSNLSETGFLNQNIKASLTSVYPSTTTAAMTAYYTGQSPLEHGWLGWTLYMKEFGGLVDAFTNKGTVSQEPIWTQSAAQYLMPYQTIFDQIHHYSPEVKQTVIQPSSINFQKGPQTNIKVDTIQELFQEIVRISQQENQQFIFAYWPNPDSTLHKEGCYTTKVKDLFKELENGVEKLTDQLKDTLLILSADHGQIDVGRTVNLRDYPEIDACLIMPPSLESRALSLFVKPNKKAQFEDLFNENFGDEFILLSKEDFLSQAYLGQGTAHRKIDDYLGDYIAIGIGETLLQYIMPNSSPLPQFKGHHAGLRKEEMSIPLIIKRLSP
ncbi:alkaline phosphatase family protein [Spirochaeta cellobiosiphila]|uniref:alkaline phosphatase family protein n=1 Tax=Spirochaeta cellobiosiphila TaxID=504483 RepID=UPI00048E165C|nr:alkaline phosphatase family protein [Spirochaeta cellobiosiphila]